MKNQAPGTGHQASASSSPGGMGFQPVPSSSPAPKPSTNDCSHPGGRGAFIIPPPDPRHAIDACKRTIAALAGGHADLVDRHTIYTELARWCMAEADECRDLASTNGITIAT